MKKYKATIEFDNGDVYEGEFIEFHKLSDGKDYIAINKNGEGFIIGIKKAKKITIEK